jgi:dihydrofolate reductase
VLILPSSAASCGSIAEASKIAPHELDPFLELGVALLQVFNVRGHTQILHRNASKGKIESRPSHSPGGGELHGYSEFMATVDALVIGRKTFETVRAFPECPYGNKRVVILSSRPLDLSTIGAGLVEQMAGSPADIVSRLAASGARQLYVDGGITIQGFLRARRVDRLVITRVPVHIGQGIALFKALPADVRLSHVATPHDASGLLKSEYRME